MKRIHRFTALVLTASLLQGIASAGGSAPADSRRLSPPAFRYQAIPVALRWTLHSFSEASASGLRQRVASVAVVAIPPVLGAAAWLSIAHAGSALGATPDGLSLAGVFPTLGTFYRRQPLRDRLPAPLRYPFIELMPSGSRESRFLNFLNAAGPEDLAELEAYRFTPVFLDVRERLRVDPLMTFYQANLFFKDKADLEWQSLKRKTELPPHVLSPQVRSLVERFILTQPNVWIPLLVDRKLLNEKEDSELRTFFAGSYHPLRVLVTLDMFQNARNYPALVELLLAHPPFLQWATDELRSSSAALRVGLSALTLLTFSVVPSFNIQPVSTHPLHHAA